MASPMKSTPRKAHPVIPEDTPLLTPESLAIDRSLERPVSLSTEEKSSSDTKEVLIVGEKKGKSFPKRRSGRIADNAMNRSVNVNSSEKKRKPESKWKRKEPPQTDCKEPRSKRRHDVNANEDSAVLLSDMLKKAKGVGESTPAGFEWEEAAEVDREQLDHEDKIIKAGGSESMEKFYDAEDVLRTYSRL
ncbi:hypothetical protein Dimus_022276 [Dionaea muscipula]